MAQFAYQVAMTNRNITFFLSALLVTNLASAQTVTLWGTQHASSAMPGQSKTSCEAQSKIVENMIREKKPTGIKNLFFASELFGSAETKSDKLLVLEDLNVKKYVTFYLEAAKLISTIHVNLQKGALPNAVDHPIFLGRLNNYLGAIMPDDPNDLLDQSILRVLRNDQNTSYVQAVQNDIANAKQGKAVFAGTGILWTLADYVSNPYDNSYQQKLANAVSAHIAFGNKVAIDFFNNQLKPRENEYNVTINRPGTPIHGKKIFAVADPNVLFSDSIRRQDNDILENVLVYDWRNIYYAKNITQFIKKYPTADILAWMGVGHIEGLAKILGSSKGLQPTQKSKIRVISWFTDASLACDHTKVLRTIKTGIGAEPLPAWLVKHGNVKK